VRQFRREFEQRRGDLEDLRRNLADAGVNTGDLANILNRLQELERARTYDDPREIERLQDAVIASLKEFEYGLRRQLGTGDEERLVLSGSDEVPEGYRALVEEYYRALSRQNR
jgi:hypothetical protein